jgi:CheY-like chemotaxis protein
MDPGGRIRLSVTREGQQAVIRIADSGIGIAPDLLPRIFELFTQVHSRSERAQGGLGIGLALVRRLTEMHGGTVSASSEGAGRGAEFTVRLPLIATATPAKRRQAAAVPAVATQRVLVADDNQDAAEALSLQLQFGGHEVRVAHDGTEALEIAQSFQPDVMLLDLGMPKMDGYAVARAIRLLPWGQRVTLIAVTGWGQQQDRRKTAEAGFDEHLVKPVAEAQLFAAVASGIGRRRHHDAQVG